MKRHVLLALLLIAAVFALPSATALAQSSVTLSANTTLVMREGPSTGYQQIGSLPAGTSAPVLGRDALSYWAYIDHDGTRGWVAAWLADVSGDLSSVPVTKPDGTGALDAPAVTGEGAPAAPAGSGTATATPTVNLRMRSGAGTAYQVLATIPAGTVVPVLEYDAVADWIKVKYNNQEGWAAAWLATIDGDLNNLSGELPAPAAEGEPPADETPVEDEPAGETSPQAPASDALVYQGAGQSVINVSLPFDRTRITLTHNGSRNFIVWAYFPDNDRDLLVNEIGPYQGVRSIMGAGDVMLEIKADGEWSITFEPAARDDSVLNGMSGHGDFVSPVFFPVYTGPRAYNFTHDGQHNFIVTLECGSSWDLIQNEIGPVNNAAVAWLGSGPCWWDVRADGNWSFSTAN